MHISEGFLPLSHCVAWGAASLVPTVVSVRAISRDLDKKRENRVLLAASAAFLFTLSALRMPSITGSSSHPTGTAVGTYLFGPSAMPAMALVTLVFQALLLAHGGLTTLGANITSMGIAGGFSGFLIFHLAKKLGSPLWMAAFLAGMLSDWATYATTSVELASALHGSGSFLHMFTAVVVSFLPTQLPLGILEGVVSAGVYCFIVARRPSLLESLRVRKMVAA